MSCFRPLKGYVDSSGAFVFRRRNSIGKLMTVPCGRCIGCRLDRSRDWAVRCVHEAAMFDDNCFLTLTYDDEHLPESRSLVKSHFQKFIRKLRKGHPDTKIRYFMCGEYGSQLSRPHYHAIIFNYDFPDRQLFGSRGGVQTFTSGEVSRMWTRGFHFIGSVTFESAAYVARYCTKKISGEKADEHYRVLCEETGELLPVLPEYTAMSLREGIGEAWFREFWKDVYPSDEVIVKGRGVMPPRYYDKLLERMDPELFAEVKAERVKRMEVFSEHCSDERLAVREQCKVAQFSKLIRSFEDEAFDIYSV